MRRGENELPIAHIGSDCNDIFDITHMMQALVEGMQCLPLEVGMVGSQGPLGIQL